jgi:dTDP-6-deoxy-L-talose 4-dehydrogenase (NAD+)
MRKRILITGASGFVGSQVVRFLENENVDIVLIIREKQKILFKNVKNVQEIITTADLFCETEKWWENILKNIDTIIHIAWYVEPGRYLNSIKNIECLHGTLTIAKAAISAKVRRFIGIGTCFEYEFSDQILTPENNLRPSTPYAATKLATYWALSQILPLQSVEFVWCRLFYLYGEGENLERLIPYIKNKIIKDEPVELTNGNQIRDYIDVKEAGNLIGKVALSDFQGAINICSGVPVSIRSMAEKIAKEYNKIELLKFGARSENLTDPQYVVGDASNLVSFK